MTEILHPEDPAALFAETDDAAALRTAYFDSPEYPDGFPPDEECYIDYDCSECSCAQCVHPVDADIIAHLGEELPYPDPVQHFRFELKRNGKLKQKRVLTRYETFEDMPF